MPEWNIGDRIENRYEIHKILGGGMGVVYICYDHEFREPFALKTFQDRYLENQQMRERFIREAETWVALEKHYNIVRALIVQNIQGKPYIFLEYIANPEMGGVDLGCWIRRGMEVSQSLNFAIQFCDGMDYAHKKVGMVHRDIKPGNILVTQDQVVKITDFGLVKTALAEASGEDFLKTASEEAVSDGVSFTRTGALMGTPPYMSPEQCRNATEVDIRSDIYAFGAVLYEMLTGRWVFKVATSAAFVRCHLYEPPPPLTSVVPGLPRNLEAVVLRCLVKNPEQRYPDFAVLREELTGLYHALTGERISPPVEGEALDAWELNNKGVSLYKLGHHEDAINCFDCALALNAELAYAWHNKGHLLSALGRYEEAIVYFDRALKLDPRHVDAWSDKGHSLAELGCYEEAIVYFDHAIELDHRHINAWYNKGISLFVLQHFEKAVVCFDHILNIDPRNVQALIGKGSALAMSKRFREALRCFTKILEVTPYHEEAKQGIALCQQLLEHGYVD